MKYLRIGTDWLPALGLGTYQLTGETCAQTVARALELGYRHIDTAERYGNEDAIAEALQRAAIPRNELWITSKVWLDNLVPGAASDAISRSIERLGVERLDLSLVHWPSDEVSLERTMEAMEEARGRGLTRYIGVSNFTRSQLSRTLELAPVVCNQVEYHPFLGQKQMIRLVEENDLILVAYSPLAQGRVQSSTTLDRIGAAHGKSAAQITLAWLMSQERVAAIPRTSSPEHLAANIDVFDFELSADERREIAALQRGERLVDPEFAPTWGT